MKRLIPSLRRLSAQPPYVFRPSRRAYSRDYDRDQTQAKIDSFSPLIKVAIVIGGLTALLAVELTARALQIYFFPQNRQRVPAGFDTGNSYESAQIKCKMFVEKNLDNVSEEDRKRYERDGANRKDLAPDDGLMTVCDGGPIGIVAWKETMRDYERESRLEEEILRRLLGDEGMKQVVEKLDGLLKVNNRGPRIEDLRTVIGDEAAKRLVEEWEQQVAGSRNKDDQGGIGRGVD